MRNLIKTFESFNPEEFNEMGHEYGSERIDHEKHHESQNYMFFGNLETIHRLVGLMLEMEPSQVDRILQDHSWAVDHIATSKDDIEEVANFFINETEENDEVEEFDHEHYMEEGETSMTYEGYMCESCGSVYENQDLDEDMTCNECGGKVISM